VAYGSSIIVMMASPFVLLAFIAFLVYRGARQSAARAETPEQ